MRFLTPTGNKRLNELVGFLCITLAMLIAAALLSYSPKDAAFNVSAAAPDGSPTRNWIGPTGAYSADLLFQIFGFAAFLLPAATLVLGWRWCRSRAIDSQVATLIGYGLLLLSLPGLISLLTFIPAVRGAIPAGGFVGGLVSSGLLAGLNRGAYLVAPALLVVAIFMTTRFSFSGADRLEEWKSWVFCRRPKRAGMPGAKSASNNACAAAWKSRGSREESPSRRNRLEKPKS